MSHLRMSEEQLAARTKKLDALKQSKVAAKPAIKQSKFHNIATEVDGVKFSSKKEAKRWQELLLMNEAGLISYPQRQVKYCLIPTQERNDGTKERSVSYIADFQYWLHEKGRASSLVVEDAKGVRTPDYILKRKMMLRVHNITILET